MTLTQRVDFKTRQRRQIRNLGDRSKRNICLKIKFTAFPLPPPPEGVFLELLEINDEK